MDLEAELDYVSALLTGQCDFRIFGKKKKNFPGSPEVFLGWDIDGVSYEGMGFTFVIILYTMSNVNTYSQTLQFYE